MSKQVTSRIHLEDWYKHSVKRMSEVAGIPRISDLSYYQLAPIVEGKLYELVLAAILVAESAKRTTVSEGDVFCAARGKIFPTGKEQPTKRCSREVQNNCYYLAKAPFARLVREMAANIVLRETTTSKTIRWTLSALNVLREFTENFILKTFKSCELVLADSHRNTLYPRDIVLVDNILQNC